jgi:hypothetical protein
VCSIGYEEFGGERKHSILGSITGDSFDDIKNMNKLKPEHPPFITT